MVNARRQAEDYAKALPRPRAGRRFLIVCDVGHASSVYADFSRPGEESTPSFPTGRVFAFSSKSCATPGNPRAAAAWSGSSPHALDPTQARRQGHARNRRAARQGCRSLSKTPPATAACTIPNVALVPHALPVHDVRRGCRAASRRTASEDPRNAAATSPTSSRASSASCGRRWTSAASPIAIEATCRRFNGYLFKDRTALPLPTRGDRRAVSKPRRRPIGTRSSPRSSARCSNRRSNPPSAASSARTTRRAPMSSGWWCDHHGAAARGLGHRPRRRRHARNAAGDAEGRSPRCRSFTTRLCETRVLDPACGTGNFLYVAMEIDEAARRRSAGGALARSRRAGSAEPRSHTVDPHQFLGIEVNPRAAAIAELVLWIGYLQWHFRTRGRRAGRTDPERIFARSRRWMRCSRTTFGNWCGTRTAGRWRGRMRRAIASRSTLQDPRRPEWPEADYIVGNPPFIGGKDIRGRLGEGYAHALWAAHPHMNESADFVMYWWDHAAELLTRRERTLKRFGLVTTNSLTQEFSRRVMAGNAEGEETDFASHGDPGPSLDQGDARRRCRAHRHDRGEGGRT